ncbi:MAG TPA: hypothetical protein VIV60_27945 [Polyangiaceae bacterium]
MRRNLIAVVGALIGIAIGVLVIGALGHKRNAEPKQREHRALLPEADGALAHVLLHWTPQADHDLARPYADFLGALDPSVRVTFVIPRNLRADESELLERRLVAIDATRRLLERVVKVEADGPITAWSKDRALVSTQDSVTGRARLIIPAEPPSTWKERHNDWRTLSEIVRRFPAQFELDTSPFDFDAGDIAVGRGSLVIDGNLLEKNRRRGYTDLQQLAARLGEYLQMQVIPLGQNFGDTPRHHLSMYMTPLTKNQALVGDPEAARAIVHDGYRPGELALDTQAPLVADFSAETMGRFNRAEAELLRQGFEVIRIVNVPFDDKTYLSYTNGVYEVKGGRHIAYVPTYDVPDLDRSAHETYRKLGWEVVPIHVRSLYPYHGTIGCVVNVLGRR